MGLFSKKEKICAICGEKVKGLFPNKIDGQYVCNDCYGMVDLPNDIMQHMDINGFRSYMNFREENNLLRQKFQLTQKIDFGFFDTKFMFDMTNRLLCMDKNLNKTIFEGRQIKSFVIREDSAPLFEGSAAGLRTCQSIVPERIMAMAPQIRQFRMMMEMKRNAEYMMNRENQASDNRSQQQLPHFDIPEPFKNFNVEIRFDHPYWFVFTADMNGPTFDNNYPDIDNYLQDYNAKVRTMKELARNLMALAFPGAPLYNSASAGYVQAGGMSSPAAPVNAASDAVAEIQRYKELLNQGIITEEEFTAKKRQLLGI